jgi:hypothetical protein
MRTDGAVAMSEATSITGASQRDRCANRIIERASAALPENVFVGGQFPPAVFRSDIRCAAIDFPASRRRLRSCRMGATPAPIGTQ